MTEMWIIFKQFIYQIDGFTTEMEHFIYEFMMSSTDVTTLTEQLETELTGRFKFQNHFFLEFHHYFHYSLFISI